MKQIRMKNIFVLGVIFFVGLGITMGVAEESHQLLTLPKGDPIEGRQTFKEFKCNACHKIASDDEMAGPIAAQAGAPELGIKQSRYKALYLADSIVFPSHVIVTTEGNLDPIAKFSRMGDFSDTLTVRQVADLVAYLKQLDEDV